MANKLVPKPFWLRKKITPTLDKQMEILFDKAGVNTVCQEAMCPNISECFAHNQATFLIMGTACTRNCSFCAVSKGTPMPLNSNEPQNIAKAVKQLDLKYVVITSSTRDDLSDGGAEHFCKTVSAIKAVDNSITVELLIPDMKENKEALEKISKSGACIIGHNLETVPRLYEVRKGAQYERSLRVLNILSSFNSSIATKSGIMLGLGEEDNEVINLMEDLLYVGCKYLSIGQYLAPSFKHTEVVEYVNQEKFEYFKDIGMKMGFKYIKSSPYTRSSYMAHEYLEGT
ncbi:MAG: lipoyl synthase [Arcobacteraceae bacterium]|nr:lipoyl synthase [Arcobacteraceae bacterium]